MSSRLGLWRSIGGPVLIAFALLQPAGAAEKDPPRPIRPHLLWAGLPGLPPMICGGSVMSAFTVDYQHENHVAQLRFASWDGESCVESDPIPERRPEPLSPWRALACAATEGESGDDERLIRDVGALYGRSTKGRWVRLSAGAGIGVAEIEQVSASGCGTNSSHTLALPLEARLMVIPVGFFGFGLSAAADVNPRESRGTLTFQLYLGRLR